MMQIPVGLRFGLAYRVRALTLLCGLVLGSIFGSLVAACASASEPIIETQTVEVTREVIKEVPMEVTREVPVEVIKEVPVEVIKEVPVEVAVEVIKEVPVEVQVEVIKEVPVEVEVTREVVREVPIEVTREVEREAQVQVTPAVTAAPTRRPYDTPTAAPTPTPWPTATAAPTPTPRPTRASDTFDRYSNAIETAEDSDTYKIVQDATGPIEISVSGIPLGEPGENFRLHIYPDWGGGAVTLSNDERHIWKSVPRGVYSIHVSSRSEYDHFPYTITVDTSKDNFAETTSGAHPLPSGRPYDNAIKPDGDIDVYKVVQDATGPIEVSVSGIPLGEPGNEFELRLNPSWATGWDNRFGENLGNDQRYIWKSVPRGVYSIHVSSRSEYDHFPYTITVKTTS